MTIQLRTRGPRPALALLAPLALAGCASPRPAPEDWQRIGFRTPEQSFHTFVTAFATEQYDLEYRCLSHAFLERNQVDGFVYRNLRDRLEREIPGFGYLSRAEVQGRVDLGHSRVGLLASIRVAWIERWLLVELVREDYYELYRDGELLTDGYAPFDGEHLVLQTQWDPDRLWAGVDLDDPLGLLELDDPLTLSEVVVGREWKLDDLVPMTEEEARARLASPEDADLGPTDPAP